MPLACNEAKRPFVALVCANAYPLFDSSVRLVGGGMETRAALFGRSLAARGYWNVSFVVSDFGQPFVTSHEGIDFRIYQPTYRRAGRNVFPRLRRHRWFRTLNCDARDLDLLWQVPMIAIWSALPAVFFPRFWRSLKPDVVCCFGNNERSAEVIADCRKAGVRTLLCVASDKDISPDYQSGNCEKNHYGMPKWKGYYALTRADRIVVQTECQREALQRYFGRDAVLIRNPVNVLREDPDHWLPRDQREFVLWIGRADAFNKRPSLFLDLARNCPSLKFVMIISRTDESVFQALKRAKPANLRIVEHVPQHEILSYLRRALVLVNTSRFEGFPNTFLESAVAGVPIVSLEVDPDGILMRGGCGICVADDTEMLRNAVERLCANEAVADSLAAVNHHYALQFHDVNGRVDEFDACIRALAGGGGGKRWEIPWSRFS